MANTQFLDEHGLRTLVGQIKNTFTRLDGKNAVTGQQTFNEGIKIAETKGVVAAKMAHRILFGQQMVQSLI